MPTYVYKCSECNQTFEYFQKMRKHEDKNMNGEDVDGLNFWLSGKDGGAGAYSSGAGRNTISKIFASLVVGSTLLLYIILKRMNRMIRK